VPPALATRRLESGASVTLTATATPIANLAHGERRVTNCAFIEEARSTDTNPGNDRHGYRGSHRRTSSPLTVGRPRVSALQQADS